MTSCEIWSASTLTATVQNATPLEAEKEARHARKDVSGDSGRAGIPANADGGRAVPNPPGRRHTEGPSDGDSLDRTALFEMGRYLTEKFPAARRTRSERTLTPHDHAVPPIRIDAANGTVTEIAHEQCKQLGKRIIMHQRRLKRETPRSRVTADQSEPNSGGERGWGAATDGRFNCSSRCAIAFRQVVSTLPGKASNSDATRSASNERM